MLGSVVKVLRMDMLSEDRRPRGSLQTFQDPQEVLSRGQATRLVGGMRSIHVLIPVALYERLSRLAENGGFVSVMDYVTQVLYDEVDRAEPDGETAEYTRREIQLIRKLLRDVECAD